MDLNLLLVVDKSKNIIAWDGVATLHKLVLLNVVFIDIDRLFAVELVGHHKEIHFLFLVLLLGFAGTEERHILAPAASARFLFAIDGIYVFLTEDNGLLTQCQIKLLALVYVMEGSQLVYHCHGVGNGIIAEE